MSVCYQSKGEDMRYDTEKNSLYVNTVDFVDAREFHAHASQQQPLEMKLCVLSISTKIRHFLWEEKSYDSVEWCTN